MKHLKKIEKVGTGFAFVGILTTIFGMITCGFGFDMVSNILLIITGGAMTVAMTLWLVYAYLVNLLEKYNSRNTK